jgi:hypothetical protein
MRSFLAVVFVLGLAAPALAQTDSSNSAKAADRARVSSLLSRAARDQKHLSTEAAMNLHVAQVSQAPRPWKPSRRTTLVFIAVVAVIVAIGGSPGG